MVELTDGSIIAQLGVTDMRLPIQYAFSYPERWPAPLPPLDLTRAGRLEFEAPDTEAFPCLRLAYRALDAERSLPGGPERGERESRWRCFSRAGSGSATSPASSSARWMPISRPRSARWLQSAPSTTGRENTPGRLPAG